VNEFKLETIDANITRNITFHNSKGQIGILDMEARTFIGDVEESAQIFFDTLCKKAIEYHKLLETKAYTRMNDKKGEAIFEGDAFLYENQVCEVCYGRYSYSACDEYNCQRTGYYLDYQWKNYVSNTGIPLEDVCSTHAKLKEVKENE